MFVFSSSKTDNGLVLPNFLKSKNLGGFTLIELIIVIAIFFILSALVITPFILFNREQALTGSTLIVKTALAEARSKTISAESAKQYGVHLSEGEREVVIFEGTSYTEGATSNIEVALNSYVTISSVSFTGGGENVVFEKLTGGTGQPGEIVLTEEIDGEYKYATVTVFSTGVIE